MKINKKHIIAILIVVAVAAWLLWKKGVFSKVGDSTGTDTVTGGGIDPIIAASGMTTSDARFVRSYAAKIESSLSDKADTEDKAIRRGYTYEQMVVLDALWTKYCRMVNGTSQFKDGLTDSQKNYYWAVTTKIMNY